MNSTSRATTLPLAEEESPAQPRSKSPYITRGTRAFLQVTLALFSAGLATFAQLYCVQPILPVLSHHFDITPAMSSVSLSVSTACMALGLLITGPISDAVGRKKMMVGALILAGCFTIASSLITSWTAMLVMRALLGLSLSGVAAVAMTYLSEEMHPGVLAFSMGLYISGNSIGGMSGRLLTGVITDIASWRIAILAIGCCALAAAVMFAKILPASRHFRPVPLKPKALFINFRLHFRDKGLPLLFIIGFLVMGAFVTLFNYIGYRLLHAPYSMSQATVGLISVVYLAGSWSSPKAGAMSARFGRGPVFLSCVGLMLTGVLLTLFASVWLILPGLLMFTGGFFAAHSIASSWIGIRARRAKGQASSMYLFCYYGGSSIAGTSGGIFWKLYGWPGVAAFIAVLLSLALLVGYKLMRRLQPVT